MEKVMRALAETENNAAAIRALQKKLRSSDVKAALDEHEQKFTAEIEKLKEADYTAKTEIKSSKSKIAALTDKVNNEVCADVAALQSKAIELENKYKCICSIGTNILAGSFFGKFQSGGNVLVVIRFDSLTKASTLYFGGESIESGTGSPLLCILPEGRGDLIVKPYTANAVCLLFGDVTAV